MKIAITQTKGGCGKTTTAAFLAVAASRMGHSVEVWDADPQGSLSDWGITAQEDGDQLPFDVLAVNKATMKKKSSADYVFIDTPPGNADLIQAAIDTADVVIVPTQASPLDVQRAWTTLEVCDHRPAAVLIVSADLNTNLLRDTRQAFAESDVFVFRTAVPKRQDIRRSFGSTPDNLHGYNDVFTELLEAMS